MLTVFKRKAKGNYIAQWYDHRGKTKTRSTRTSDKAAAVRIGRKWEAEAALRREGVIDADVEETTRESRRSIADHLADFGNKMQAEGNTQEHVGRTVGHIRKICEHAGFATIRDIRREPVDKYTRELQDKGRSSRTIEAHLTSVKAFTRWLTAGHKLPRNPLAEIETPNPEKDRRLKRRALSPDEWPHLDAATRGGPVRIGMEPVERALLYLTAIETGLRVSELQSLTRGRLYLNGDHPYVTVPPADTKSGKNAKQYILPPLAKQLRKHISTKLPKAPVFAMPELSAVATMLRADLAEARQRWINEAKGDPQEYAQREESDFLTALDHEGERIDFHALRHTCGAWLSLAGQHPQVVQRVMRHSTIQLTMDTYGHLAAGAEIGAIDSLASLLPNTMPETLRATGTDSQRAVNSAVNTVRKDSWNLPHIATTCDDTVKGTDGVTDVSPEENDTFCDSVPMVATVCTTARTKTRSVKKVISSPQGSTPS